MKRRIFVANDMTEWKLSNAYFQIIRFIEQLNELLKGRKMSDCPLTPLSSSVIGILERIEELVKRIPPVAMENQRYGNVSFRQFHQSLDATNIIREYLPSASPQTTEELCEYLEGSFGNEVRLDYGTGHELNFIAFLLCILHTNPQITETDFIAFGLKVMKKYFHLSLLIQSTYSLEPAGSHGVWGLDDYQFMPFLLGSSQLINKEVIIPPSYLTSSKYQTDSHLVSEYHYVAAIDHVRQIKRGGHFWEHSPVLFDISGVSDWDRINKGLFKMYKEEVLHKLPVVQHFLFGEILSFTRAQI